MRRILETLLLAGFSALFLYMYFSGEIALYIHPRFHIITVITGFVLAGLALARFFIGGQGCGCEKLRPANYSIFILPLILVLLLPNHVLDVGMAHRRGISLEAPSISASWEVPTTGPITLSSENFLIGLSQIYQNPAEYRRRTLELTGFVFQPNEYGPDTFVVSRFAISCCIADATVVGFLVQGENINLEENQWVRVVGTILPQMVNNQVIPVIMIESLELIEAPGNPYVFLQ